MTANISNTNLPKKIKIDYRGTSMEIIREWFGWQTILNTAISFVFIGFALNWHNNLPQQSKVIDFSNPINAFIRISMLLGGVVFIYFAIIGWFNETHIYVSHTKIIVRHKPFPFFGNKTMNAADIRQLYAKENISLGENGSKSISYEVRAITQPGKELRLIGSLLTKREARVIEKEIEKFLNINNIHIEGEA